MRRRALRPARRQPIAGTPASAAASRWSDAACLPERESASRSSSVGGVSTSSGSAGPPRPMATTTTRRSRARMRATWPATAVFPIRLPRPITASDGVSTGSNAGGSKRKSAPTYGSPSASAREAQSMPLARPEHRLVGEVDDEIRPRPRRACRRAARRSRRPPRSFSVPPTSSAPTTSYGSASERIPHDRRVVLAVDQREGARLTSSAPRPRSAPCTSRTSSCRSRTG